MKGWWDEIRIWLIKKLAARDLQVVMNVRVFGGLYLESDRSWVLDYKIVKKRDAELEERLLREAREIINNG